MVSWREREIALTSNFEGWTLRGINRFMSVFLSSEILGT